MTASSLGERSWSVGVGVRNRWRITCEDIDDVISRLARFSLFYNMDSSVISSLLIKTINSYESFKVAPIISEHFRKFSEDFPKIFEICKNALKTVLNNFRSFPRISEHFRSFPKFFRKFWKVSKNALETFSDHFRKFSKSSEDFWTLPNISENFPKIFKTHKKNFFKQFPKIYEYFRMW